MRKSVASFVGAGIGVIGFVVPASAAAAPTVTVTSPADGDGADGALTVNATATSTFTITSFTAKVGAQSATFTDGKATLDLSSIPAGDVTLTISASDAGGGTTTITRAIKHDQPPKLTVQTLDGTVARPNLRVQASCTDTGIFPCASFEVVTCYADPCTVLKSGTGKTFDQTISLAALDGTIVKLFVRALKAPGLYDEKLIEIPVELDPHLVQVAELPGVVADFDASRILFADSSTSMAIKDRGAGTVTSYAFGVGSSFGYLTSVGAWWKGGEVRNGVGGSGWDVFIANGDWAVTNNAGASYSRRNQATNKVDQAAVAVATPPTVKLGDPPAIDASGNVAYPRVFATTPQVNVVTPAGTDSTVGTDVDSPIIDGDNVVFVHPAPTGRGQIQLHNSNGIAGLSTATFPLDNSFERPYPYRDYLATGGWIAFTDLDESTVPVSMVAKTRSPAGVQALATALVAKRYVLAGLNAKGEIAYDVTPAAGGAKRRYLGGAGATAPAPPISAGGPIGTMKYVDGTWYKILGRSIFKVDPTSTELPDGGAPGDDAGAVDAGGSTSGASTSSGGATSSSSGTSGTTSSTSGAASSSSGSSSGDDDGGCATGGGPSGEAASVLGLLAVILGLRRRRR